MAKLYTFNWLKQKRLIQRMPRRFAIDCTFVYFSKQFFCPRILLLNSVFLAELLGEPKTRYAVWIRNTVPKIQISMMLDLFYKGEVQVAHKDLPLFYLAVKYLKLKGLKIAKPAKIGNVFKNPVKL